MVIQERTLGDVTILSLSGDIVFGGSGVALALSTRVRDVLDRRRGHVVLDVSRVRYIDSAGLGDLLEALVAVKHRGGWLRLAGVSRRLRDVLILAGLSTVFECFDDVQHAMKGRVPDASMSDQAHDTSRGRPEGMHQ